MKRRFSGKLGLRLANLLVVTALVLMTVSAAQANIVTQSTFLVSHGFGTELGDMPSKFNSMSAWKPVVAFDSKASNLDILPDTDLGEPGLDCGGDGYCYDIFSVDFYGSGLQNVKLVTDFDPLGEVTNGHSYYPVVNRVMPGGLNPNDDGKFVAYQTAAEGLPLKSEEPGVYLDGNGKWDIFLTELSNRNTWRVSVAWDDPETSEIFEYDSDNHSGSPSGLQLPIAGIYLILTDVPDPDQDYFRPFVVFHSDASNLVPGGDSNGKRDIFVRDVWGASGIPSSTTLLSRKWDAGEERYIGTTADSYGPSVSQTGRYVAFTSLDDLLPEDTNGVADVYLLDRDADNDGIYDEFDGDADHTAWECVILRLVSRNTETQEVGNGASMNASISAVAALDDFIEIAFQSNASNLLPADLPEDTNGQTDVYVYKFGNSIDTSLECVSTSTWSFSGGVNYVQSNGFSGFPVISGDGRRVAFHTTATNLLDGGEDSNGQADVYIHDRLERLTWRVSLTNDGRQGTRGSVFPAISGDGQYVSFWSESNLINNGESTYAMYQVFLRDLGNPAGNPNLTPTSWKFGENEMYVPVGKEFRVFFLGELKINDMVIEGNLPDRQQFTIAPPPDPPDPEKATCTVGETYDPHENCYFTINYEGLTYGYFNARVRLDIYDKNVVGPPGQTNRQIFISLSGATLRHFYLPLAARQ